MQFTDQLNRVIDIASTPKGIISVVPSQTELLYDLGLEEEVIGITKFCVHPEKWFKNKTRVGGTKKLNIEKIRLLQPDLIIANKEENGQQQIEILMQEFPVWISNIKNLSDACNMIHSVGNITNTSQRATDIIEKIKNEFAVLSQKISSHSTHNDPPTTAYFIWRKPWMVAAGDTFINDMLTRCGLKNIAAGQSRYPVVNLIELQTINCKLVLLSSEPFPFKEKHIEEIKSFLPDAKILLADGEFFSWYGSRLLKAPAYFLELAKKIFQ